MVTIPAMSKSRNILQHQRTRLDGIDHSEVLLPQEVPRIVRVSLPCRREPLARRPTNHDVDVLDIRDVVPYVTFENVPLRPVVAKRLARLRVIIDADDSLCADTFEPEVQAARAREQGKDTQLREPVIRPTSRGTSLSLHV
ncbi:hypothetical protein BHQ19_12150 [Mycolicibacterium porcinum]|nr:hypothetical protein BHQ19_12150 [Mycolicibacterium porcinum]